MQWNLYSLTITEIGYNSETYTLEEEHTFLIILRFQAKKKFPVI